MQKRWLQVITGLLMAGWMAVIFWFSSKPAEASSEMSGTLAYQVVDATDKIFRMDMNISQILSYALKIEHPIRKIAHMTEYGILALTAFAFYTSLGKTGRNRYLLSVATAAVYAATDEFHQIFVRGRGASIVDVGIDTAGALIALLLLVLILKKTGKHCEKQQIPLQ